MNVFFSIIIPTLNEERYISGILSDLSEQDLKNFEVLIVDGKSSDRTTNIASKYRIKIPSLRIIDSNKRNVSFQRNLGARRASGKYLLFFDADTRIGSDFLKRVENNLKSFKPNVFSNKFTPVHRRPDFTLFCTIDYLANVLLTKFGLPAAPGCFLGIKKSVFSKLNGFSEKFEFAEDRDLIRRCFKNGFYFVSFPSPTYKMSFRRIEKIGMLRYLLIYIAVNIKRELKIPIDREKEYPMGGEQIENYDK